MRSSERGSIGGVPLFVLGVIATVVAGVAFAYLPDGARSDPSYGAVAASVPTWFKITACIAIYVIPVALAAVEWRGFTDDEPAIGKAIDAATAYLFAPAAAIGALWLGSFWWLVAGLAAGLVASVLLRAVLRRLVRPPDE